LEYLTTHSSLSPIRRGFAFGFVNYKKGCTRLAAASRWFSPGTLASSTTKSGRHDIAEILLKVELNTKNLIKSNLRFKVSDYPFGIFILFLYSCKIRSTLMYLFCEMIRYNTSALNHLPQKMTKAVHIAITILSISKTGKLIIYIYRYILESMKSYKNKSLSSMHHWGKNIENRAGLQNPQLNI
jgi:hypothetical protein